MKILKTIIIYLIAPFYILYNFIKYWFSSDFLDYLKLVWECNISILQIKFGLRKTYNTVKEMIDDINQIK